MREEGLSHQQECKARRWGRLACVGNGERCRMAEARRVGQLQKGRRESLVRGSLWKFTNGDHHDVTEQRARVPAVRKAKLTAGVCSKVRTSCRAPSKGVGDKPQIHSNLVFELGVILRRRTKNLVIIVL